jgi:hypothetical protein
MRWAAIVTSTMLNGAAVPPVPVLPTIQSTNRLAAAFGRPPPSTRLIRCR